MSTFYPERDFFVSVQVFKALEKRRVRGYQNRARIERFHSIRVSFGAKSRFPDLLETLVV
jgi:hypothetical protein